MINYIIDKNRFSIAFYSQKYLKISNARISIANDQCYSYTNPIDSYQNLHHRISSQRHKRGCTRFRVRSGRALNIQPLSIPAHPFLPAHLRPVRFLPLEPFLPFLQGARFKTRITEEERGVELSLHVLSRNVGIQCMVQCTV